MVKPRFALFAILTILAVLLSLLVAKSHDIIMAFGHRLPDHDLASGYVDALLWALTIFFIMILSPISQSDKRILTWLWLAKVAVTLGVMLYYESVYGLDAYYYFRESQSDFFDTRHLAFGFGTSNIIGFTWCLSHFLPGMESYHAIKVIYSGMGLLGVYLFYKGWETYTRRSMPQLLLFLGLFPSILFWSSILGKDPINLLGIGIYSYGVLSILRRFTPLGVMCVFFGVLIASSIRVWAGLIFLTPLVITFVLGRAQSRSKKVLLLVVCGIGFSVAANLFIKRFQIESTENLVARSQLLSHSWEKGGSSQDVPEFNNVGDMIRFAPKGMFTALFRPLPGEVGSVFGLLSGLENIFLLVLMVIAMHQRRRISLRDPAIIWSGALIMVWAFSYGFVSYQNLGTAVRFKLQILPVMLSVFSYMIYSAREAKMRSPIVQSGRGAMLAQAQKIRR